MTPAPSARIYQRGRWYPLATGILALGLLSATGYGVFGEDDDHSAESNKWDLANGSLSIAQQNYNEILVEVTSSNNQDYTTATVNTGAGTPMTFRIESECGDGTSGNLYGPLTDIHSSGILEELNFLGPEWLKYQVYGTGGQFTNFDLNILSLESMEAEGFTKWDAGSADIPGHLIDQIKERAIERCNARLASIKQNNPNLSDASALISSGGVVEIQWDNVKAQQVCRYHRIYLEEQSGSPGHWQFYDDLLNTDDMTVVGKVQCISPFSLPEPAADDFVQAFGVLSAELAAQPNFYRGACPTDVVFNASVVTQGAGQIEVQVVNQAGELRLSRTIDVTQTGPQNFSFYDTFDYPEITGADDLAAGGGGDDGPGLTIPPPVGDPAQLGLVAPGGGGGGIPPGPGNIQGNPDPPNVYSGWYRLLVSRPTDSGVQSNIANYRVVCERPEPGPQIAAVPDIPACMGGVVANGQCICEGDAAAANGRCGPASLVGGAVIVCQGGTVVGGQCTCPEGQSLENGQCIPVVVAQCTGGAVVSGQCVCPQGQSPQNGQCIPNPIITCAPGFVLEGNNCVPSEPPQQQPPQPPGVIIDCAPGFVLQGNTCVPSTPPQPPPQPPPGVIIDCAPGFVLQGNTCVPSTPPQPPQPPQPPPGVIIDCAPGFVLQGNTCVPSTPPPPQPPPVQCPNGFVLQGNSCVPGTPPPPPPGIIIDCAPGFVLQGGNCIQCPPGFGVSNGRCVPGGGNGAAAPATPIPGGGGGPPASQQVIITCTNGTVENQQCVCPPRWSRETIAIAPTAQIYNCRPPQPL